MSTLRPPLPPTLSHDGIRFVLGAPHSGELSQELLSFVASTLCRGLPPGDFTVDADGNLLFSSSELPSLWRSSGRLEAIDRSTR
jgi:hypothetical protein